MSIQELGSEQGLLLLPFINWSSHLMGVRFSLVYLVHLRAGISYLICDFSISYSPLVQEVLFGYVFSQDWHVFLLDCLLKLLINLIEILLLVLFFRHWRRLSLLYHLSWVGNINLLNTNTLLEINLLLRNPFS